MVARTEIKPKVYAVLAAVSHVPEAKSKDSSKLRGDLLLGEALIAGLAVTWTRIAKSYPGGRAVSQRAAKATKTVGNCVDLVTAKANGK